MNTTTTLTPGGVLEWHDPNEVVIEANVRPSAPVTPEFVEAIRQAGILVPTVGRRDQHGNVLIRMGQRRTLAARAAGTMLPVLITDADEDTAKRITDQLMENDHRAGLRNADRAAAFQQLAFEGLTPVAIAKRTATKTDEVKKALVVAQNPIAVAALEEHDLTLLHAAALIEFQDDPATRAELIEVATTDPDQFDHAVQQARDEAALKARIAEAAAVWGAKGYAILGRGDVHSEGSLWVAARWLRTADGELLTPAELDAMPIRGVTVTVNHSGALVETFYVQDPEAHGFTRPGGAPAAPLTDEEAQEAKAEKSRERKILIANNKAWDSAEKVRRAWLTSLLGRKSLPENTELVIAEALTTHRHQVSASLSHGNALAHTLLRVKHNLGGQVDALANMIATTPTKARRVILAIALAGMESNTRRENWRYGDDNTAAYLRHLAAWGYPLSPVEQVVTGDKTPSEAAGIVVDHDADRPDAHDQDVAPLD